MTSVVSYRLNDLEENSEIQRKAKRLLMIYDTPHGPIRTMIETAKNLFHRCCVLCTITHSIHGKREEWDSFEQELGIEVVHLSHNEVADVEKRLGEKLILPCVVVELHNGDMEVLLTHVTINHMKKPSVSRLRSAMKMWAEAMNIAIHEQKRLDALSPEERRAEIENVR